MIAYCMRMYERGEYKTDSNSYNVLEGNYSKVHNNNCYMNHAYKNKCIREKIAILKKRSYYDESLSSKSSISSSMDRNRADTSSSSSKISLEAGSCDP